MNKSSTVNKNARILLPNGLIDSDELSFVVRLLCKMVADGIGRRLLILHIIYTYNSVLKCRQNIINSSASTPLNATKIAVKKISDVDACMFGPDLRRRLRLGMDIG